jgi:hypothetical protein
MDKQQKQDERVWAAFRAWENGRVVEDADGRKTPRPKVEIDVLWEAMWAAADFSWDALADARWSPGDWVKDGPQIWDNANPGQAIKQWKAPAEFPGGGPMQGEGAQAWKPASLQDYWRWVPNSDWTQNHGWGGGRLASDEELRSLGLIVEADGKLWHAIHRPHFHVDISELGETVSAELANAVRWRLLLAGPLELKHNNHWIFYHTSIRGADTRAQFNGARAAGLFSICRAFALGEYPRPVGHEKRNVSDTKGKVQKLHLTAHIAHFGEVYARDLIFGDGVSFAGGNFSDAVHCHNTQFGKGALFVGAYFANDGFFTEARFEDQANFSGSQFSTEGELCWAHFSGAEFGSHADFSHSVFEDNASFDDTNFGSEASFSSARFGADTSFCKTR